MRKAKWNRISEFTDNEGEYEMAIKISDWFFLMMRNYDKPPQKHIHSTQIKERCVL